MLTLPFHNFFLHSSSKIPLLFFSDFISEHVFLSLISFLYLHCFTNFLLAYSLCVCLTISSSSVCPASVISSSLPPPFFPFQDSLFSAKLMVGRLWLGADPSVLSCVCPWTFLSSHLWKQGSVLSELLVWSSKAVSVISSIWLCLDRAVNKCDLLSATSQKDQLQPSINLCSNLVEQMKRRQILQFLSLSWSTSRGFIGSCPFACMLLVFFSENLCSHTASQHLPPGHKPVSRLSGTHNHFCAFCPHQPFPTQNL